MKLSEFYLPLLKEIPSDAQIASHRLMLRAGLIRKIETGIYAWLPLGLRVLSKIQRIIREEHEKINCHEMLMPCIQPAKLWKESGRYDAYGKEMLRITDRHDKDILFGPTNEEVITDIFRRTITSYKSLPQKLYQIQWKFRDEIRPRFGVMRAREFLMKDAYSFDINQESAYQTYKQFYECYMRIFSRIGLIAVPVRADTGAIGGSLSHEFHIKASTGESSIFYDKNLEQYHSKNEIMPFEQLTEIYSAADEMHIEAKCPVAEDNLVTARGIEVGHIFNFGDKYSRALNAAITSADGQKTFPNMGSYGIGISRLVAATIEASHDEQGIIWPQSVAPFDIAIINLKTDDENCRQKCQQSYNSLQEIGFEVLYDDRNERAGVKFSTIDVIGIPMQIIIGPKLLADNMVEIKIRADDRREKIAFDQLIPFINQHFKATNKELS